MARDGAHIGRNYARLRLLCLMICAPAMLVISGCGPRTERGLSSVAGHLPDLRFDLTGDDGRATDAGHWRDRVVLLYFGFAGCGAECPVALSRLQAVFRLLGPAAPRAHVLFVTVDPANDTPRALRTFLAQFDGAHMTGLTGPDRAIARLAWEYRTAYRESDGMVTHGAAIYVFDGQGRARFLATPAARAEDVAAVVRSLLR